MYLQMEWMKYIGKWEILTHESEPYQNTVWQVKWHLSSQLVLGQSHVLGDVQFLFLTICFSIALSFYGRKSYFYLLKKKKLTYL
jgi:hypothetical protein